MKDRALAALAALLAPAAGRAEPLEVDQANAWMPVATRWSIQAFSPVGQELRPSRGAIQWAELHTEAFAEGGAELLLRVRPISGPVLGESAPVALPAGLGGLTHFRFGARCVGLTTLEGDFL